VQVHVTAGMRPPGPADLFPLPGISGLARRDMIAGVHGPVEAENAEGLVKGDGGGLQAGHADLEVQDVLGVHAGDRGTADVLDPPGQAAQVPAQIRALAPGRPVLMAGPRR
jgi:hypothetical protein